MEETNVIGTFHTSTIEGSTFKGIGNNGNNANSDEACSSSFEQANNSLGELW